MLAREADRRYPVGQYEDPKAGSQVFVTEDVHYDAASQINHIQSFFRNEGSDKEDFRAEKYYMSRLGPPLYNLAQS